MTTDFKIARIRYTWKGNWAATTEYVKDDVVAYGGKTFVCFVTHTSGSTFAPALAAATWVLMLDGYAWRSVWATSTLYNPGDLVRYNGIVYRCLLSHTSSGITTSGVAGPDTISGLEGNISRWETVARSDYWTQDWTTSTRYKLNDLVKYGATVYRCTAPHNSVASYSSGLEADVGLWQVVYQQNDFKGDWTTTIRYKINDVVKYGGSLWIATAGHTATAFAANLANWTVYLDGLQIESATWDSLTLYQRGDVVAYGGYVYSAGQNNTNQNPFNNSSYWSIVVANYNFVGDYTATTGGLTPVAVQYKVGDVVRLNGYLYVATADNTLQEPPNVGYWKVVNQGSKWRGPWFELTTDIIPTATQYKLGDIVGYGPSTFQCILAHGATVGSRPDTDIGGGTTGTYWTILVQGTTTNVMTSPADGIYYNAGAKTRLPAGTDGQVLKVSGNSPVWGLWGVRTKVYYVALSGTDAAGYGTSLDKPFRTVKYACDNVTGTATIYVKSGVYSEQLPITIQSNVALVGDELRGTVIQPTTGYTTSNMFYVRDGSVVKNMTLQGLSGTLTIANAYGTKRTTAGAYISLDPTGIGNVNAQIIYRSPYIQNVTAFGTGCIGMKVDGDLHAAGNKSIVTNDFTNVISDGIGVWVTNGGRAELVSIFTYYCHIGYLAENGGKIRATNGNNSYGDFGSVSEGTLAAEVPITGTINNGGTHATVGFVFTDGSKILGFEYDNAGVNYDSSTTFSFTGSGLSAAVSSANVRPNGVYEIRLTDETSSGSYGGGGYLSVINYAQSGSGTGGTIYLSAGDSNVQSNYLGMRIVIISGRGAGQYGYISSYSPTTKLATILKESNGTAGWDAMQSVNAVVDLDTTSQYSIEPRITFSAPGSGTRAQARAVVTSGRISKFRVFEPGSGYASAPTIVIGDPNGSGVEYQVRIGNGVLATPTFSNRGTGYLTASAIIVAGTGYADSFQFGKYLYVSGLTSIPGPGANISVISSSENYRLVSVDNISGTGPYAGRFTIYPELPLADAPPQGQIVTVRNGYSQTRLTGHDFLEVGTGNTAETNYPNIDVTEVKPQNLAVEAGGGRVFYTATDQDGNFRVGSLFKVEQASGTATLNASFFQLNGLSQLSLGGIVLGGTSATVTEISTDATLPANSDNVLVTQRAIKSYIASRIGGGGANLNVNEATAGQIRIATSNQITNTLGIGINFKNKVNFTGGVDGSMLATASFISSGAR
jgi:hypothetical protein